VVALNPLSSASLLGSFGALGLFIVLFAETGLLIGFVLPGDSLLFTAGVLCSTSSGKTGHLSLPLVLLAAAAGAVVGAQVGYYIGRSGGRRLLERTRWRRLRQGAEQASRLLERYGYGKAIVLGRFIPIVRTVLNPAAGTLGVPARTFTSWQIAGGIIWSAGLILAGYGLGSAIPNLDSYLLPVIAAIVVAAFIPIALELRHSRAAARTHPDGQDNPAAPPADPEQDRIPISTRCRPGQPDRDTDRG
jgi:membrane-associated protein